MIATAPCPAPASPEAVQQLEADSRFGARSLSTRRNPSINDMTLSGVTRRVSARIELEVQSPGHFR